MFRAFRVRAVATTKCDKCHELSTPENPIVELENHDKKRFMYHCIQLHVRCIAEAVAQALGGTVEDRKVS